MDYTVERENNIIKNIAKEIVLECLQSGFETSQELADYLVKLKMLNPKNGFTASEVMPRSLTQQLVMLVVEDLKQNTPAMNCLKMQVYWSTVNLDVAKLKAEYINIQSEKAEVYLSEILALEKEDIGNLLKNLAPYILVVQNLGNVSYLPAVRETAAAIHSVLRNRHMSALLAFPEDQKIQKIKDITKKVTGIRLFLKATGKAGEGIEDIKSLTNIIEDQKEEIAKISHKIAMRIDEIQYVIPNIVGVDNLFKDIRDTADVLIPSEFDESDLKYLKQILTIMLQHNIYISDIASKLEEIDGDVSYYVNKLNDTLEKLQSTIQERDAVPTTEIYDDFTRAGEIWTELLSYYHSLAVVQTVASKLEEINKKEYFIPTALEKFYNIQPKHIPGEKKISKDHSSESSKTLVPSSFLMSTDSEDFHLEFGGFCAWTLYYGEGYLIPGSPSAGYYQYNDQYYSFASKMGQEMWSKDPYYYLIRIYEFLRLNPELIGLLNAYDSLYNTKSLQLEKKVDRKVMTQTNSVQTILHPVEKYWDKDYTFSEWELKKRALLLSRLTKCVTKSAQTIGHSHYRSSIGIMVAPDKDKEVQTKRDNSCVHSTISTYLFGLRGCKEDKFKVLNLTQPVTEQFNTVCENSNAKI